MAYDDNLYQNPGPSPLGALAELGLMVGIEYGHARTTRALAGARTASHTPLGWWRDRARQRMARRASREIWQSFTSDKGWRFGDRWGAAKAAATRSQITGAPTSHYGKLIAQRLASQGSTGRAIAGLARPVLGVANAYLMWGALAQGGLEAAAAGVGELRRFGQRLRSKVPESSIGWRDMAVREQAFTMRQASLMSIHMSQSGARAALGNEANFLHS